MRKKKNHGRRARVKKRGQEREENTGKAVRHGEKTGGTGCTRPDLKGAYLGTEKTGDDTHKIKETDGANNGAIVAKKQSAPQ